MSHKNAPIGVFDSGLGGLTAVRELRKLMPDEDIIYFGDTGRVPYGTRSKETIIHYAKQDIAFLLEKKVKYIMAACGTVSSTLPQEYTNTLSVEYTGVVNSAAAAAIQKTKTGRIGVIGTPATINSKSYNLAINALMPNAFIVTQSCPLFVPLVENGYFEKNNKVATLVAQDYLNKIKKENIDVLILGCTHYPIMAGVIADVMGDEVTLIDPGAETAKKTMQTLKDNNLLRNNASGATGIAEFYVSDSAESFSNMASLFLGSYTAGNVFQISVDNY